MQIRKLEIRRFRGFRLATIAPTRHVALLGEPRAGRSEVIEALTRVLSPEMTRLHLTDDLDFFERDRGQRAEVEVTVGDLGDELTQLFFDHLEYWDGDEAKLVEEVPEPTDLDQSGFEPVVRLCYRAAWSQEEELANHWVDYPKTSDPDSDIFDRVRRRDLQILPFFSGQPGSRPLSLAVRAAFRRLVQKTAGEDLGIALEGLTEGLDRLALELASTTQIRNALELILDTARLPLNLEGREVARIFRLLPEGGALGGILRSLAPALELPGPAGFLPLTRHGSTATALLAAAELLASAASASIVVIDDFGENLDNGTARHLASILRSRAAQVWISTRRPPVAEAFHPGEIVRLALAPDGERSVYHGHEPRNKAERMAARHFALQVLPAITARAIVLLEGPHDRASILALAERLLRDEGEPLPAGSRIAIADADVSGSGGSSALPRLAAAARRLGFFVVAVIDGDQGEQAQDELRMVLAEADAVIRLTDGYAIERAIFDGLSDEEIREGIRNLDVDLPPDLDTRSGDALITLARQILKRSGGFHAQFLDGLPPHRHPILARRLLKTAIQATIERQTGLIQL